MTPAQGILYRIFRASGVVVPVTARNIESFRRVALEFTDGAVLDFGGIILLPGRGGGMEVDREWLEETGPDVADALPLLEGAMELAAGLAATGGSDAVPRLVGDEGRIFYMVAKSPSRDLEGLLLLGEQLERELGGRARVWMNGNNLAVLPLFLDKAPAVRRFMDRHLPWPREGSLTVGLGDSLSDSGFLSLCDFQMSPSGSQLQTSPSGSQLTGGD
jgi:hypothetical protein